MATLDVAGFVGDHTQQAIHGATFQDQPGVKVDVASIGDKGV